MQPETLIKQEASQTEVCIENQDHGLSRDEGEPQGAHGVNTPSRIGSDI